MKEKLKLIFSSVKTAIKKIADKGNTEYVVISVFYHTSGEIEWEEKHFGSRLTAEHYALFCAIDDLEQLCSMMDDGTYPELRFVPTMGDEDYYIVINAWDGPNYQPVVTYKIVKEIK